MATSDAPSPPFQSLKMPVSADDRASGEAWMLAYYQWATTNKHPGIILKVTQASLDALSDSDFVKDYNRDVQYAGIPAHPKGTQPVPGPNPLAPLNSIVDFLNRLWSALTSKEFWIRAAEVVGGLLILALGVDHMNKTSPNINISLPEMNGATRKILDGIK